MKASPSRVNMPNSSPTASLLMCHTVARHTSHVTRNRGTRHTSHVTRHTSHVTRHTSHVTRHKHHTCSLPVDHHPGHVLVHKSRQSRNRHNLKRVTHHPSPITHHASPITFKLVPITSKQSTSCKSSTTLLMNTSGNASPKNVMQGFTRPV